MPDIIEDLREADKPDGDRPVEFVEGLEVYERQPGETNKSYGLFCVYRDLGPAKRSIRQAAKTYYGEDFRLHKVRVAQAWSSRWRWVERVTAWDEKVARDIQYEAVEEAKKARTRHLAAAQITFKKAMESITSVAPGALSFAEALRGLEFAIKTERLIRGDPTEHIKQDVTGDGTVALQVVERIVTISDRDALQAEQKLLEARRLPSQAEVDAAGEDIVVDDGKGEIPQFELPELPPMPPKSPTP